jgi:DNA-binding MarR family transcriptional regulator
MRRAAHHNAPVVLVQRLSKNDNAINRLMSDSATSFDLDSHIFFLFGQIFGLRNRELNRELKPYGLDYQRWRVLAVLSGHPGCSMQTLADLTAVDRTTLNHTLRLMIAEGLVDRQQRADDRRSVAISLTKKGSALLAKILPLILAQNARSVSGFKERELAALIAQLRRMMENLRD